MNKFDIKYAKELIAKFNYDDLFSYCKQHSDEPDGEAYIGICYHNGYGVEKDAEQAFFYDNKAAQDQSALGLAYLAYDYLYGFGTEKDINKGMGLLNKAVAFDVPEAYRFLGYCYEDGDKGLESDATKDHVGDRHQRGIPSVNLEHLKV